MVGGKAASVSQAHPEGQTDGLVTTSLQKTFRSENMNMNKWQPVLLSSQWKPKGQKEKLVRKLLNKNNRIFESVYKRKVI